MEKRYLVTLTTEERSQLQAMVSAGKAAARKLTRARILLLADEAEEGPARSDPEIVDSLGCGRATVERVRKQFVDEGLEALNRKPTIRIYENRLDGKAEAHLVAITCGSSARRPRTLDAATAGGPYGRSGPCGFGLARDGQANSEKNDLKPWLKKGWCLPQAPDGEFVAAMEDVLGVYHRPYDPQRPVVCMDEASKQLVGEVRQPLPPRPGQIEKYDSEYRRLGTANIFMAVEPLAGQRTVQVTDRRTKVDWACFIRHLLDDVYPNAKKVVLVMDNLNTHSIGSLYEAFDAETARSLAVRLEIHYTPKHGSWLNMAETELSILCRQCLDRRIDCQKKMTEEIATWEQNRNSHKSTIEWQFTNADARIKLKRLYPSAHD